MKKAKKVVATSEKTDNAVTSKASGSIGRGSSTLREAGEKKARKRKRKGEKRILLNNLGRSAQEMDRSSKSEVYTSLMRPVAPGLCCSFIWASLSCHPSRFTFRYRRVSGERGAHVPPLSEPRSLAGSNTMATNTTCTDTQTTVL